MKRNKKSGPRSGVLISVADEDLERIEEIEQHLKTAGLDVDQVLKQTGVIMGTVEPAKVSALKKVRGVSGVETSHSYQIAPPESDIQ